MNPRAVHLVMQGRFLLQVHFRVHFVQLVSILNFLDLYHVQHVLLEHMELYRGHRINQLHVNNALLELSMN